MLYSRLISDYFNFQAGVRQDMSAKSSRTYAVIGVEGLAPGFIQTDSDLYICKEGELSTSFTAFYDLFITNRLILQPRLDVKLQMQRVPDLELGRDSPIWNLARVFAMNLPATSRLISGLPGIASSAKRHRLPD